MTKGQLDKIDLKLLGKLASEGPSFFSSASWEMRACEMRRTGFMNGEMACYSMTGGGKSMNFKSTILTPRSLANAMTSSAFMLGLLWA